jgi:DNA-binding SARP family transcriptional activator
VAAPDAVDAARFETLAARALTVAAPTDRLLLLGEALGLWHGDPYPDLPNVPSAQAEAVRLVELRDRCREDRAEAMLAVGRSTEAVADMLAMTVSQPLRERPWRLLMLALHRSGRQAEALAVYRRYDATLADEGLAPSPSVDALRTAILATPEPPPAVRFRRAGLRSGARGDRARQPWRHSRRAGSGRRRGARACRAGRGPADGLRPAGRRRAVPGRPGRSRHALP